MMYNNSIMHTNNEISQRLYAGVPVGQGLDIDFYTHIRLRFLQQSAQYLGADLDDIELRALCSMGVSQPERYRIHNKQR